LFTSVGGLCCYTPDIVWSVSGRSRIREPRPSRGEVC
jgi:hypothetical protein